MIMNSEFNEELFYLHETTNGYHLYLMSKTTEHFDINIILMRILLNSDLRHGQYSLYNSIGIRLSKKYKTEKYISKFVTKIGKGSVCGEALKIYNKINKYMKMFDTYFEMNKKLFMLCNKLWNTCKKDFGLKQIQVCSTNLITDFNTYDKIDIINLKNLKNCDINKILWDDFMKNRKLNNNYKLLLIELKKKIKNTTVYKIIESTDTYVIGYQPNTTMYFICYKNLLMLDYDINNVNYKCKLQNIYDFCDKNKNHKFRLVKSENVYHLFLTSHIMKYNNTDSIELSIKLHSDPLYILTSYIRGYAVRLNNKNIDNEYIEIGTIGTGKEIPGLLKEYNLHLKLHKIYKNKNVVFSGKKNARNILESIYCE